MVGVGVWDKIMNTCNIVNDDGCIAVFDVRRDQRVEPLLASCIPELHSETLVLDCDSFGNEVDSDSGLNILTETCSWPVKLSKMKRLIMEVLPTD
jgi:hypothetical protein